MIRIKKLKENIYPTLVAEVTVKQMGNITEVRHMEQSTGGVIRKIDANHYYDTRTGEVHKYSHSSKRIERPARSGDKFSITLSLNREVK